METTTTTAMEARAAALLRDATARWLVKEELVFLLLHFARLRLPIHRSLQIRPPSGCLLLYDTTAVPDYKKDGWRWQKRKDHSGRVREDRAKLPINRQVIVLGTYVHSSEIATFHRRSYMLRDSDQHVVLVHYFDEVNKTTNTTSHIRGSNADSSVRKLGGLTKGMKRSLPVSTVLAPTIIPPSYPLKPTVKPDESVDTIMNDCFELDYMHHASRHQQQRVPSLTTGESDFEFLKSTDMGTLSGFDDELLYPEISSRYDSNVRLPSVSKISPAHISDFSPDWDFTDGGAKILICLASPLPQPAVMSQGAKLFVQFGILNRAPAEKISETVVRCTVDERQCKIRVVERLSEFHHAIWTTASPAELLGVPNGSTFLPKTNTTSETEMMGQPENPSDRNRDREQPLDDSILGDSATTALLGLDDSAIETLSDKDLEQLSEKLLERVVRQLVTLAHTSEELLDELNSLDEAGLSLLHYVSFYNYSQLVPLLLSHGAQINQQSTQGQTALHLAAGCGHIGVVEVLVQSGADLFAVDFDGFTAADRAEKSGHSEAATNLRRLMGNHETEFIGNLASNGGFDMDIDFGIDHLVEANDPSSQTDEDVSHPSTCESPAEPGGGARSKHYVGENQEHNRKLLLGAFSTMSLHDKCALSLSISRDSSTNGSRRRGSSIGDDTFLAFSVGSLTPSSSPAPDNDLSTGNESNLSLENDSLGDSDVKSVIADDEENLTKLEAAMELMGPEERQSLEDEVKVLQHNIRAWLLRRNCKNMRETTKRLHEATKTIQDQQKQQEQLKEASERETMQQNEMSERERAAVTVQAATRSMLARKSFLQTKNVTIKVQAATRGVLCRKNFARMKTHALASLVIQRNVREWWHKQPGALKPVQEVDAAKSDQKEVRSSKDGSNDDGGAKLEQISN
uniref:CG-1 domain-containing protein n=1 Tax=Globisporangium ultimum (strain ATCC 200006 / CBS 805.95 / DAOM BR144) TaxID=431595 RepID=K3WG96_GLOUD